MAGDSDKDHHEVDHPVVVKVNTQAISPELDLDKNPIKYAQHDGTMSTEAHDKDYMELTLRSGKHSELVQKILRQRIEQRAKEFPRWPATQASGVRVLWIESRFWYDRERLLPDFDDDWRKWRAKYIHSLELDPREPVHVPEYEREFLNPIRRFYMKGGDLLENQIIRRFFTKDKYQSATYRVVITRGLMLYATAMVLYYYTRYNYQKWEHYGGFTLSVSAPIIYPGDPRYPFDDFRTEHAHHWSASFPQRTIFKDLRHFEGSTGAL